MAGPHSSLRPKARTEYHRTTGKLTVASLIFWREARPVWKRRRARESGYPTSSNRASSMHLHWVLPAPLDPVVAVSASLTVLVPPSVAELYFWALQASFVDERGQRTGAGHLGLQWHPAHPTSTAANWGGYAAGGGELRGTDSPFPSARGNPNTRDFWWEPGRPYRLRIEAVGGGAWSGSIDGSELRHLHGGGVALVHPMVWSEVFARCDDPTVVVRWSGFEVETATGVVRGCDGVRVTYQPAADGGCDNTTVRSDPTGEGWLQVTNTDRELPPGSFSAAAPGPR